MIVVQRKHEIESLIDSFLLRNRSFIENHGIILILIQRGNKVHDLEEMHAASCEQAAFLAIIFVLPYICDPVQQKGHDVYF